MNKQVNYELKLLNNWLDAKKLSYVCKIEVVLFKSQKKIKQILTLPNFSTQQDSAKYLTINIDENLSWHH